MARKLRELIGGLLAATMLLSPLCFANAHAAGPPASKEEQLEKRIVRGMSWKELHTLRQRYGTFDDGAVAEEYSDVVVDTLAKRWNTLAELQSIGKTDPAFEKFVLEHIDATADTGELKMVFRNATKHAPAHAEKLCGKIATAARAALADDKAAHSK